MARDMAVYLELNAEDRASAVLASFEGEIGKLGDSTESLGGVLRKFGVNLEENVNKKLATNEKILAAASKAYKEGRISAADYDRATLAIATANDKLRASLTKSNTEVEKSAGIFKRLGAELSSRFVVTLGDVTRLFGSLVRGMGSAVTAATEQEDAIKRLGNALADLGPGSKHVTEALVAQAGALQEVTLYSDEAITAGQAFAASFVKGEEALKKLTLSAVDLAAGIGIDLQTAFELLTKASQGSTAALSRYGLVLDEGLAPAEKFAALQKLITDRFGGRAQADVSTFSGAIAQLKNQWGEILEVVGEWITKDRTVLAGVKSVTAALKEAGPQIKEYAGSFRRFATETMPYVVKAFQAFGSAVTFVADKITRIGDVFGLVTPDIVRGTDAVERAMAGWDGLGTTIGAVNQDLTDAEPAFETAARSVAAVADEAERAGPAFTSYRTAAQLAAAATIAAADATEASGNRLADFAETVERTAVPALTRLRDEATRTAQVLEGVYDRSGALIQGVTSLSMGGTRAQLAGGGSRLVGSGGTYGSQQRTSVSGTATYIADPTSGRVERIG